MAPSFSITAIERGCPTGEPWSPKLSKEARSIRALLEQHGFVGADSQKLVMKRLQADCSVETSKFRTDRRVPAAGLRIGDQPTAEWFGIQGAVE